MSGSFLREHQIPFITWRGPPRSISQIHMFIKNNQAMSRVDFKTTLSSIRDFLEERNIDSGILMTPDGTYVFTEKRVEMDPLLVKLATGINYNGVVRDARLDLDLLNRHLAKRTK